MATICREMLLLFRKCIHYFDSRAKFIADCRRSERRQAPPAVAPIRHSPASPWKDVSMNLGFDHPRAAIRDRPASRPSRHGGCDHADLAGDRAAGDRGQQAPVRLGAQREHAGHSPVDAVSRRRGDCPFTDGAKADLENYYLTNLIGNPLDTTVMLANLMFS